MSVIFAVLNTVLCHFKGAVVKTQKYSCFKSLSRINGSGSKDMKKSLFHLKSVQMHYIKECQEENKPWKIRLLCKMK